jgi:hypothetical protein
MTDAFNRWWDSEPLIADNLYPQDTPVYWAWEGWQAAIKAEREKVAQWMMQHGYATGHGDTLEDLLTELDWQIVDGWNRALMNGVKTEREACAKICEEPWQGHPYDIAKQIRARGRG